MKQLYAEPTLIIQQQPDRQLPRRFADGWLTGGWILVGLRPEDQEEIVEDLLAGPESPAYEAAWAEAAEREVIGPDKVVYRLRHEGGLWLIPAERRY
jgi:hypothetical protein